MSHYKVQQSGAPVLFLLAICGILVCWITGCTSITSQNIHLKYGNPSSAGDNPQNYLLVRSEYALSYNCSDGIANWASWQLDRSWLGRIERSNDFRPNTTELPSSCYAVRPNDYRGSGYDRGHLVPSGDRTRRQADNSSTFLMSNIIPQSPRNNREVWRELEEYCRDLAYQGKTLYIVAGGQGVRKKIAKGNVAVPQYTWKAILILSEDDVVTPTNASTLAVWMPNSEQVRDSDWQDYLLSVDQLERKTQYDLFSALPKSVQKQLEQKVYEQ